MINVLEKIRTQILRSVTIPPPENRAIYEIILKNIVEPDRPKMPMWRIRLRAGLITLHTHARTRAHTQNM
jgi:hypothetical protein